MYSTAKDVTLPELLDAKEARVRRQQQLLQSNPKALVSYTLNLAGPIKRSPLSDLCFYYGLSKLKERLGTPDRMELTDAHTGLEAMLCYSIPAETVKRSTVELEETLPCGRLLDLDVLDSNGTKLERKFPRRCIVCGGPASPCARSRVHGLDVILAKTEELLRHSAAEILGDYGVEALLEEVRLTPKPGLVDLRDNGAHRDMTPELFETSAKALRSYFVRAAELGMEQAGCMPPLQAAGLEAERTMLAATGGVNTHKGAIYCFGLALAAAGSCLVREDSLFERAAALAKAGAAPEQDTHGAAVRKVLRTCGARQEAEAGFPTARAGLCRLEKGDGIGALMEILLRCEDSNLLWRGGEDGLQLTRDYAKRVLDADEASRRVLLEEMNREMIRRNLSPGGSADLLALGMLLRKLKGCIL